MADKREYKINIDPRILELLGPSLYTNIYYVLAELIANAYDANASNVYIIEHGDKIVVEDDGAGMSYATGDIERYLSVAVETRTSEEESFTADRRRRKIGRKGVGKLAALSVSEKVLVMTRKAGETSGFVLSRHVGADHLLEALDEDEIVFERIKGDGTSVVMTEPQYGLNLTADAIKNNLLKIFPLVNREFRIHIVTESTELVIESFDKEMIQHLGALLILGKDFQELAEYFDSQLERKEEVADQLLRVENPVTDTLHLKNRDGEEKEFSIQIKGWLGAYRSTRGRKENQSDFPDNFISLLANGKLGEYNILPIVGKNRLPEVYVVGQLHVDLFEETGLPDMSLSNRQGYRTDDRRYEFVIKEVRESLLPKIIAMREKYADHRKKVSEENKVERRKADEEKLRNQVEGFKVSSAATAAKRVTEELGEGKPNEVADIIQAALNDAMPILGLKTKVDEQKRKVLICHSSDDKDLADIVYSMLSFNGIADEEMIYTSCVNAEARVPEGTGVFDHLREFFVNSYSDKKILVLYVTSNEMAQSWGAVSEVGAGWITEMDHKIFNVEGHRPQRPLDIDKEWQTSKRVGGSILMEKIEADKFVEKIMDSCKRVGFSPKSKQANMTELKRYATII